MVRVLGNGPVTGALDVVKAAVGPNFQIERELVEVFADHAVVVEVLIEIRFAIAVEIMQAGDLVAP